LLGKGVIVLAYAFVGVRFCILVFALILLHRNVVRVVPKFDFQFIKTFQLRAMPFGLAFLCFGLYTYFDKIVISLTRSEAEVGLYNAGFQIYEGLMIVPVILAAVLYPRLSQLFVSDKGRLADLFSRGMKYMIVIALPVAAWGLLFSEDIIARLFGHEYLETALSLSILLCGIVISFQNVLLHTFLNSIDRQKYMLITTLAGLFVAICLDLILIPRYGIVGAAIATIGYALTIFSASYGYIFLRHTRVSLLKIIWKPLLCVLLISVPLWRLGSPSTVLSLIIFIPLYVLLLLLLKTFDGMELELFHRLVWRRLLRR
jgi:O-antigen/teichoic acid export membrane protein